MVYMSHDITTGGRKTRLPSSPCLNVNRIFFDCCQFEFDSEFSAINKAASVSTGWLMVAYIQVPWIFNYIRQLDADKFCKFLTVVLPGVLEFFRGATSWTCGFFSSYWNPWISRLFCGFDHASFGFYFSNSLKARCIPASLWIFPFLCFHFLLESIRIFSSSSSLVLMLAVAGTISWSAGDSSPVFSGTVSSEGAAVFSSRELLNSLLTLLRNGGLEGLFPFPLQQLFQKHFFYFWAISDQYWMNGSSLLSRALEAHSECSCLDAQLFCKLIILISAYNFSLNTSRNSENSSVRRSTAILSTGRAPESRFIDYL